MEILKIEGEGRPAEPKGPQVRTHAQGRPSEPKGA